MLAPTSALSPYHPLSYPLYCNGRLTPPKENSKAGAKEESAEELVEAVLKKEEETVADSKVEEEKQSSEATSQDTCTQTPRQKPRRRGGQGSRARRMLAFQAMLTFKRGLPLSRLLSQQGTDARFSKAEFLKVQEKSASPRLKAVEIKVEKEEEEEEKPEEIVMHTVEKEKEEKNCPSEGVSSGEFTCFTPRSFQTGNNLPSSQPLPYGPDTSPCPIISSPLSTPPFLHHPLHIPLFGQMPGANWVLCGGCHTWGTVVPIWVM